MTDFVVYVLSGSLAGCVEGWYKEESDKGGEEHSGVRGDTDGSAAAGSGSGGYYEGIDAEDEAPGGHQYCPVAEVCSADG